MGIIYPFIIIVVWRKGPRTYINDNTLIFIFYVMVKKKETFNTRCHIT